MQPRLKKVEPLDAMKLRLYYETGEVKVFDVAPYAIGPWFGELADRAYFRTVQMLPGGSGIEWSHGQDIAPHELYDLGMSEEESSVDRKKKIASITDQLISENIEAFLELAK